MSRKSKKKMKLRIRKNSLLSKLVIVAILLVIVLNILRYAAYFKKDDNSKLIVMIQNDTNAELVHDVYIDENNVIYFSEDDMKKYFDKELYYEKDESNLRRYISISQNKILEITEGKNNMYINSTFTKIKGSVISRDGIFYFPLSELTDIYNIDVEYIKDKNRLNIDKLDEEKNVATVNRDTKLKYKMTGISKTVENLAQGDKVTILGDVNQKWIKVKTKDYQIGYVKKSKLIDFTQERDNLELSIQDFSKFDLSNERNLSIKSCISNFLLVLVQSLLDVLPISIGNSQKFARQWYLSLNPGSLLALVIVSPANSLSTKLPASSTIFLPFNNGAYIIS